MRDVLAIILGGGQGRRLFPLTERRAKPAVPLAGKYRLIDIPVSNCLHADIRRIFILTQFNSASLNRHVGQTYRLDTFSRGFVEILAAEQTPDNPNWYQGTADAVRQAVRHFERHDADYYLILAGDHLYRMNYAELVDEHIDRQADITVATLPVGTEEASAMGILRLDRTGRISGFEEKPTRERLLEIGRSLPVGASFGSHSSEKPFVASMGVYVFSRDVLLDILASTRATDFGREVIPAALGQYQVQAFLFRGYWADVGTIQSFYDANILLTTPDAPFRFYDPQRPVYTHPRFLPGSRLTDCVLKDAIVAEGCFIDQAEITQSVVGIRTRIHSGARIRRSVLLGADYYGTDAEATTLASGPKLGLGQDVELDRVIVDKNARIGDGARLVNAAGIQEADGNGYFIRNGVIIVPKDGIVPAGTVA